MMYKKFRGGAAAHLRFTAQIAVFRYRAEGNIAPVRNEATGREII
jgi:hypothetical protein